MKNLARSFLVRGVAAILLGGFAAASANAFYFVDWPGSGRPPRRSFTPPTDKPPAFPNEPPFTDLDNPRSPLHPEPPDSPDTPVRPQGPPDTPDTPNVPEPATLVSAALGLAAVGGWAARKRRAK